MLNILLKKEQMTDEELIRHTLQNQVYFGQVIERYQQKLLRYIMKISNLRMEEAEDTLQDIFIKVYQNLNGFDSSLRFSSWIYRITHNEVISRYRKYQRRPEGHTWDVEEYVWNNLASSLDTKALVEAESLQKSIQSVLEQMDGKYREVLIIKFLEEKDYGEISDILQKPLGTVGTLISRAKKQFQKEAKKLAIEL